jgi:hypothetical protein
LLIIVLLLGMAAGIAMSSASTGMTPTGERIVTACLGAAVVVGGFLRLETKMAKSAQGVSAELDQKLRTQRTDIRHDTREELNPAVLKAVEKQLNESAFPTTAAELKAFIQECQAESCKGVGEAAARAVVEELKRDGWPPTPGRGMQL